jgi:hypothetical protein
VVVLSPEFVRKKYPMQEVNMFLERKARAPDSIVIIPVFHELTVEQCNNLEQLYSSEPWPISPSIPEVDKEVLKGWAADVQKMLECTGVKIEEVRVGCNGYVVCTSSVNVSAQRAGLQAFFCVMLQSPFKSQLHAVSNNCTALCNCASARALATRLGVCNSPSWSQHEPVQV